MSVNASSLPSGEDPTGSFAMTCSDATPGCYPYASESVDCVNVQGSVAVVSGPISQDWDPSTHYRATMVFFDRDADGLLDSFMHAGFGYNASGEPGSPNCTMYNYQPYYDVQAGDIAITDVPGTTTPTGTDVVVAPSDQNGPSNVELKFGDVSDAGTTTLTTSEDGPGPTGFALGDPAVYYNLETTATFTGEVEVCIQLTQQPDGDLPHLYHYTNGAWTDITSYQDPGKICGLTSSFSPFALGVPEVVDTPDTTPPTVTGVATRSPNSRGWYRGDVRIDWTATDDGSGVAAQPADTVVTGQGANLTAESPQVCDTAATPNCTHGTVTGLKIDRTAPALAIRGVADGATYTLGAVPTPTCTASDQLSGLAAPCQGSRSGGNANGVGPFTYTAAVSDRAGNIRTVTASYRVVYRFDGFQAPSQRPVRAPEHLQGRLHDLRRHHREARQRPGRHPAEQAGLGDSRAGSPYERARQRGVLQCEGLHRNRVHLEGQPLAVRLVDQRSGARLRLPDRRTPGRRQHPLRERRCSLVGGPTGRSLSPHLRVRPCFPEIRRTADEVGSGKHLKLFGSWFGCSQRTLTEGQCRLRSATPIRLRGKDQMPSLRNAIKYLG